MGLTYGADSLQAQRLREAGDCLGAASMGVLSDDVWPVIRGTLHGLKNDVDAGLIGSLELRGAGTSLGDMLALAKDALADSREGTNNVAAVLTAVAFEDTIRRMGETLAAVEGRPKLEKVIGALKRESVLVGGSVTTALSYRKFRNDALHAHWKDIDVGVTHSCLTFVENLLLKHFS